MPSEEPHLVRSHLTASDFFGLFVRFFDITFWHIFWSIFLTDFDNNKSKRPSMCNGLVTTEKLLSKTTTKWRGIFFCFGACQWLVIIALKVQLILHFCYFCKLNTTRQNETFLKIFACLDWFFFLLEIHCSIFRSI